MHRMRTVHVECEQYIHVLYPAWHINHAAPVSVHSRQQIEQLRTECEQ
jgi:hypothetical protein